MKKISKEEFKKFPKTEYILSEYLYKFKDHMDKHYAASIHNDKNVDVRKIKSLQSSYKTNYYNIMLFDKYLYMNYNETDFTIRDLKESHIKDFLTFCKEVLKNKPITVNQKLVSIRLLMKYICAYYDIFPYNIAIQVPKLKIEAAQPAYIKNSDINKILSIIRDDNYGIRDVCICKIIMTTGLRIGDIFTLKLNNIDMDNKFIRYNNGRKELSYPIQDTLYKDLVQYLALRKTIKSDSKNLFINSAGKPKNIRSFQITFRNAVIKANLSESYTAQNLRASFLYEMGKIFDNETELQDLTNQKVVKQYLALKQNPLNNI